MRLLLPFGPPAMLIGIVAVLAACTTEDGPVSSPTDRSPLPPNSPLDCDPGQRVSIEQGQCVPVGPANVPAGFAKSDDGFRLVGRVPTKACAAGERPAIDHTSCVPIDDCNAAFPPANAAFVVTPGAKSSGKVVGTLDEALALAKTGDLIALDSGEYPTFESSKALHFVGRCASKVTLKPTPARATGVWFTGAGPSSIESVTIVGAKTGLRGGNSAGELTVRRVVLSKNENALDATGGKVIAQEILIDGPWTESKPTGTGVVAQSNATIELEDSAILNSGTHMGAAGAGAHLIVRRSLVRGPEVETNALSSVLFAATMGGVVDIEESVLTTTQALGLVDSGAKDPSGKVVSGIAHIARSELTQTGKTEIALSLLEGGRATLEDSSIFHKATFGVGLTGGELALTRSALVADAKAANDVRELLDVAQQSHVTATDSALVGGFGTSVWLRGVGTTMDFDRSLLTGTRYYLKGRGIALQDGAALTMLGSSISGIEGTSVLVGNDGHATIETTLIDAPKMAPGYEESTGVGVLVHESSCVLDRVLVRRAAGPAISFSSGSAILRSSRVTDSLVGLLLIDVANLMKVEDEPSELLDGQLLVYRTELLGNATDVRQADGFVPPASKTFR